MGTLIDTLEASGGASAIFNEFEIRVAPGQWEVWTVGDETLQRGMRTEIIREHHVTAWDDLIGVLSELGVPDEFDGWR